VGDGVKVRVKVDVGIGVPPHDTVSVTLAVTGDSVVADTEALLIYVPEAFGASAEIVRVYALPVSTLPTFQLRLLPVSVAVPMGAAPTSATPVNCAGIASVTTTPSISRPGTGPFPKMRRHTYPSHSSTKTCV
jgi:hypothetical protein